MRANAVRSATAVLIGILIFKPAMPAAAGPVATACAADKAKFCADVPHGGGQVRACLDANKDKVSEDCRAALGDHGPGSGTGPKKDQAPKQ